MNELHWPTRDDSAYTGLQARKGRTLIEVTIRRSLGQVFMVFGQPHDLATRGEVLGINVDDVKLPFDCDFGDVNVNGNRARLTLSGTCVTLTIVGNNSTVMVDGAVEHIVLRGNGNVVRWKRAATIPTIVDSGTNNVAQQQ